jgi:hypothetical protein
MSYLVKNFNDETLKELETKEQVELFMTECPNENLHCFYWDVDLKERLIEGGVDQDSVRLIHRVEDE